MDAARASAMAAITSYRDLDVWMISMDLVDRIYADVKAMPRVEFDLRRQIKKAVTSIPSNVAEGWRRKRRRPAYANHVSIAMGSQGELETELEICFRNGFLKRKDCAETVKLLARVGSMLDRLYDSLDP
jgi:four helix bundle protein